jgi:Excalibur calcium-binding domain
MIRRLVMVSAALAVITGILAAPVASADPTDVSCTIFNEDGSCFYPNCTAAKKAGECNIQQGSPHYCPQQDRDGDGVACEC